MRTFTRTLAAAAFALTALVPFGHAAGAAADPNELIRRMARVNANLKTYTATTHVDIAMHSFPFVSPALDGNYYYKHPNRSAIVFNTVPALAKQFQKIYPKLDPPATWPALYDVSEAGDEGGTTTLRLVPKKSGRIDHLDVKVDNANATVSSYVWTYKEGGSISFEQQYEKMNGNFLVKSQSGKVDLPSYKADVTSAFSNFKLNVPIADKVFAT